MADTTAEFDILNELKTSQGINHAWHDAKLQSNINDIKINMASWGLSEGFINSEPAKAIICRWYDEMYIQKKDSPSRFLQTMIISEIEKQNLGGS